MNDSKRPFVIVSAFVFDETGAQALHEAVRMAERVPSAELHVLHVASSVEAASPEARAMSERLAPDPAELTGRIERACLGTEVSARVHLRRGDAVKVILQMGAELEADVLIVGSHQRRGIEKFVLGSVAEQVLRNARCPVLVAMPKSWEQQRDNESIEPPCPDCLAIRNEADDPERWCARHSHARMRPHLYQPSNLPPKSTLGS